MGIFSNILGKIFNRKPKAAPQPAPTGAAPAPQAAPAPAPAPQVRRYGRFFIVNGWVLTAADLERLGLHAA